MRVGRFNVSYKCIDVAGMERLLSSGAIQLIDVRDSSAFSEAAMKGAQNINYNNFRQFMKVTPKETPIIVYCYHGHASKEMAQMFVDFGYQEVYSLDGGYEGWRLSQQG